MDIILPQKFMNEIFQATEQIQKKFPEHYQYLSETPLFMFDKQKGVGNVDFEHYLASLVAQLAAFEQAGYEPVNM
jgi:hypothetical protein